MKHIESMALALLTLALITEPAYAYLDPGTGGMLLQIILGGLAGLAVAGKLFWQQLKSFFRLGKGNVSETESDDN